MRNLLPLVLFLFAIELKAIDTPRVNSLFPVLALAQKIDDRDAAAYPVPHFIFYSDGSVIFRKYAAGRFQLEYSTLPDVTREHLNKIIVDVLHEPSLRANYELTDSTCASSSIFTFGSSDSEFSVELYGSVAIFRNQELANSKWHQQVPADLPLSILNLICFLEDFEPESNITDVPTDEKGSYVIPGIDRLQKTYASPRSDLDSENQFYKPYLKGPIVLDSMRKRIEKALFECEKATVKLWPNPESCSK